jgi:hypothetical protein
MRWLMAMLFLYALGTAFLLEGIVMVSLKDLAVGITLCVGSLVMIQTKD